MKIQYNHSQIASICAVWHKQGETIAFVPTMGNLHAGHLALINKAKQVASKVVVSIFVNPLQFGENEDYSVYPRTIEQDIEKLQNRRVDLLYTPEVQDIFSDDPATATFVEVPGLSSILCGEFRPSHFRGVTTIVNKLFNIVQPDFAVFGKKDYQQFIIIKRMVDDLGMQVKIIGLDTVREKDGLAMSSRNAFLSDDQRQKAALLNKTLNMAIDMLGEGNTHYSEIETRISESLQQAAFRIDYVSIRCADNLALPQPDTTDFVVLAAVWLGQTRLIDNVSCSLNAGKNTL